MARNATRASTISLPAATSKPHVRRTSNALSTPASANPARDQGNSLRLELQGLERHQLVGMGNLESGRKRYSISFCSQLWLLLLLRTWMNLCRAQGRIYSSSFTGFLGYFLHLRRTAINVCLVRGKCWRALEWGWDNRLRLALALDRNASRTNKSTTL